MIKLSELMQEEISYKIYCDMDGVLVDFDRGYKELTGISPKGLENQDPAEFWKPITQAGAQWWIRLKWMPDGKALWDYIKQYSPDLLSAPSREESSKIGKRIWVKRELPDVKLILKPADEKYQYATPTSILIDDRQSNIAQWNQVGGIGIFHTSTQNTIKEVQKLGL